MTCYGSTYRHFLKPEDAAKAKEEMEKAQEKAKEKTAEKEMER